MLEPTKRYACRRGSSQEGAGLVEVLVAIGITGIAIVGLLAGVSTGSLGVSTTGERVSAENLARSQLELTKSQTFDPAPATYATVSPPAGYGIAVSAQDISGGDSAIQLITVTVSRGADTLTVLEGYKVDR
jgi:type II secretory pathway pseudopilin PulG